MKSVIANVWGRWDPHGIKVDDDAFNLIKEEIWIPVEEQTLGTLTDSFMTTVVWRVIKNAIGN